MKLPNSFKQFKAKNMLGDIVKKDAKKNKNTIIGAQAIIANLGSWQSRPTKDWDLVSNKPKAATKRCTKKLNKVAGTKRYYSKPSEQHAGTHKVYNTGMDNVKGTLDDEGVIDITQGKVPYKVINGVRYATLQSTVKDKETALRDKQFAFRHKKDKYDLRLIKGRVRK